MNKNLRPLAAITADIHKAERANIFVTGRLLLEAKEQASHGKWLPYLKSIGWSDRNAQLHMSVARLAAKYETISYLNAAATAFFHLVWLSERYEDEEVMPLAIERLKQSVARGDSAGQQREAVTLTPQAMVSPKGTTELALKAASDAFNQNCFGDEARYNSMMDQGRAILEANPKTEEELKVITDKHPIIMPGGKIKQDDALKLTGRIIIEEAADEEDAAEDEETETLEDMSLVDAWDRASAAQRCEFYRARKVEILHTQHEVGDTPGESVVKAIADRAEARSKAVRESQLHEDDPSIPSDGSIPDFLRRVPA
jgi:hypothetical protein